MDAGPLPSDRGPGIDPVRDCATNADCLPDELCRYPLGTCGADEGGVCEARPEGCDDDCPGVCGCDGNTYCNQCVAAADGINVESLDACDDEVDLEAVCDEFCEEIPERCGLPIPDPCAPICLFAVQECSDDQISQLVECLGLECIDALPCLVEVGCLPL